MTSKITPSQRKSLNIICANTLLANYLHDIDLHVIPYIEGDFKNTVEAFDKLVEAVEKDSQKVEDYFE